MNPELRNPIEETEGSVDDLEVSLSLDHLRAQRLALRERYEFACGLDSRGVPKHTKPEPFMSFEEWSRLNPRLF